MNLRQIGSAVDLLWRAVAVFRVGALGWVAVLIVTRSAWYDRPLLGWTVFGVMVTWTGFTTWAYAVPRRRTWPLLTVDLAVALACLGASYWVLEADELRRTTLPMAWVAAPVVAWAIHTGRRAGVVTALVVGTVDALVRGWVGTSLPPLSSINATVLLLLAGVIVGYLSRAAGEAQRQLQEAAEREAATKERERLARGIHDSVLQVLALVQRRGAELGGEAAQLGRLAGEQEATLRVLVAGDGLAPDKGPNKGPNKGPDKGPNKGPDKGPNGGPNEGPNEGTVDLRTVLNQYASTVVTIAAPAVPVPLPVPVAGELAAAVGSAVDNVRIHCGQEVRAWLLVESEPDAVTVTIRDEGPGIPDGRLAQAAADGRLGVAQSIQGRMRDLGGAATITSVPGQGTEVELRLPLG